MEIPLAHLIGGGHPVDNGGRVGIVLAIFNHFVGEAEQRVQPPHAAKSHLPQPVRQAVFHEGLKAGLILNLFRVRQPVFFQKLSIVKRRVLIGFIARRRVGGGQRGLFLLARLGDLLAACHLLLAAEPGGQGS